MSMRSTVKDTDKFSISIYGRDRDLEVSLGLSDHIELFTAEEAEDFAKQLIRAAAIKRTKTWIYEKSE